MDKRIAKWLASRDTGASSKAIVLWLSAGVAESDWGASTPSDPADLARCLRLLERIPEWKARMPEMANAGGLWPTFARRWDEITASFLSEVGGSVPAYRSEWSTPKTYALMKTVHAEAYGADKPKFTEVDLGGATVRFAQA